MQMKSMAVKPRILADDLQIFATGPLHLEWFTHAFDKTHLHLQDMGARIAPSKSLTFSSNNTARQWLREHRWRILQDVVPVVNTCRDLGAHLNSLVNKKDGETLTDRMQKTAGSAEMMGYIKTTYQDNRTVIKGKILPMGLYGCEVAPVNEAVFTKLRGTIANVITFTTKMRAVDLTFAVTSEKGDLDPDVEICRRRVTALRRCYHGNDEDAAMIQEIYKKYQEKDEPATKHKKKDLMEKNLSGPPASKERAALRQQCRPHGPVGLLLETMHLQTAAVTSNFMIKNWNQPPIDIMQAPHQHLPILIKQMCTRNRTRMAENERHETDNLTEIDAYATSGQTKDIDNEDLMQLNLVRTGSLWTKSSSYWTGRDEEKMCSVCMEEEETSEHIIWRCRPLQNKRKEADSILASIDCKRDHLRHENESCGSYVCRRV